MSDVYVTLLDVPCACGCIATVHIGPQGACVQCRMCLGWVRSEAARAALIDRELSEIADFDGRAATVDVELSADLLTMLVGVEAEFEREHGWDNEPVLHIIHGIPTPLGQVHSVMLTALRVPDALWMLHDAKHHVIEYLTHGVQQSQDIRAALLGDTSGYRFLGVALVAEGWVRAPGGDLTRSAQDHPELRDDECRFVWAVDVDERQYNVMHFRRRNTITSGVVTSRRWLQDLHAIDMPEAKIMREMNPDGLPPIPRALRELMRALSAGAR